MKMHQGFSRPLNPLSEACNPADKWHEVPFSEKYFWDAELT